ncbi:hypothetical protein H8A99_41745 [Bradyrhizobium sp. Arg68]|uniref:hypothetical protein n=1 Tax=Bradyrhizobium ivorense TaxID=2511166 RepID=UPI001E56472A|nr:hypothetical protein [Bradyrhizobium ivorense]MCC8942764.1 hypothetical protein [Bradyrhizobium ivorense]
MDPAQLLIFFDIKNKGTRKGGGLMNLAYRQDSDVETMTWRSEWEVSAKGPVEPSMTARRALRLHPGAANSGLLAVAYFQTFANTISPIPANTARIARPEIESTPPATPPITTQSVLGISSASRSTCANRSA